MMYNESFLSVTRAPPVSVSALERTHKMLRVPKYDDDDDDTGPTTTTTHIYAPQLGAKS